MRRKGFTLAEMLVVIVVIAIFALIVLPRLLSAGRSVKEADLQNKLGCLQLAVDSFYGMHGDFPIVLEQLVMDPSDWGPEWDGGNSKKLVRLESWQPYLRDSQGQSLREIPMSPFLGLEKGNAGKGWDYDCKRGEVRPASTLNGVNGRPYNERRGRLRAYPVPPSEGPEVIKPLAKLRVEIYHGEGTSPAEMAAILLKATPEIAKRVERGEKPVEIEYSVTPFIVVNWSVEEARVEPTD